MQEKLLEQSQTIDVASHVEDLQGTLEMIGELEHRELEPEVQNLKLKKFIKKIHFTRIIPDEIKKLSTRNPLRREYPASYEIEYF